MVDLRIIQEKQAKFIESRKWDRFSASQVYTHLIEELGEIASHILYLEKYKIEGAGHKSNASNIGQEIAQAFNLLLQLATTFEVNLEDVWEVEYQKNENRFSKETWEELSKEDGTK